MYKIYLISHMHVLHSINVNINVYIKINLILTYILILLNQSVFVKPF